MALPWPTPAPPWVRGLWQIGQWLIPAGLAFALEHIGTSGDVDDPVPGGWRHVQLVFEDPTDAETANRAVIGFDIANITNGIVDPTWSDTDYQNVQNQLAALVTAYAPYMQSRARCFQARYYVRQMNPLPPDGTLVADDDPYAPSGPPERITAMNIPGTGTGVLPPQCAISVTERTAYPKHWGRFYLPFPSSNAVAGTGRITSTAMNAIGGGVETAYTFMMNGEYFPVVPVTSVGKVPARGLLSVEKIAVDDVFDVIRRRRTKFANTRFVSAA